MRQISYMEQRPLIGPDEDSDGWKSLPAVNIYGKAFSVQLVEVTVTVSHPFRPGPRSLTIRST